MRGQSHAIFDKGLEHARASHGGRGVSALLQTYAGQASGIKTDDRSGILCEPAEREILAPEQMLLNYELRITSDELNHTSGLVVGVQLNATNSSCAAGCITDVLIRNS
jgi:hypothetical protein